MTTGIEIGTGKPTSIRTRYSEVFAQLAPGKFVEAEDAKSFVSVTRALRAHIRRKKLPWKLAQRSAELRIYVLAAE